MLVYTLGQFVQASPPASEVRLQLERIGQSQVADPQIAQRDQLALHDLEALARGRIFGLGVIDEQARQIEHAGHPGDHRPSATGPEHQPGDEGLQCEGGADDAQADRLAVRRQQESERKNCADAGDAILEDTRVGHALVGSALDLRASFDGVAKAVVHVGEPLRNFRGILTGVPIPLDPTDAPLAPTASRQA